MKSKTEKFPVTVKAGSASVKIYREEKPSGTYYRVGYYLGSKRTFLHCDSLEKAKSEAQAKAKQLSRGDVDAAQLTGRDRLIYGRALEALRQLGMPLDSAAIELAEAKALLGSFSLVEAARFYMRHHGYGIERKPVAEAVAEMITAKAGRGVSQTYLADLRYRLGAEWKQPRNGKARRGLANAFHCDVSAITREDLRIYLDGLKLEPRGYNNTLGCLRTFFTFAQDRRWLSKEADLLNGIEKRRPNATQVDIFTPEEMAELFANASAELRPCFALAAFAGVRQEEILRMDWEDVYRRPGYVEVCAHKAKTAARRLVPFAPNLAGWLALSGGTAGRVWPHSKPWLFESVRDTVKRLNAARSRSNRKDGRFEWKTNALRHSFISYRLAEIQDVSRVALEAGNSPRMIFQHYRELCTPEDAREWFQLGPGAMPGSAPKTSDPTT